MTNASGSEFNLLPVDLLELDLSNPRIAQWVEMYGGSINPEQMSLALGKADAHSGEGSTTFHSLRESIRTSRGIIHPILVNRKTDGTLVVIEGNTRTLIYREFKEQGVSGDWDRIPAMVHDELSPQEIDAIRLQAHLVGPRQWDPYSKAKYLEHLRNTQHLTMAQVVDFCGGRDREVSDYIAAYHDMESHYRPLLESDDQFDHTRFSSFVELQKTSVREALLVDYNKDDFAAWVNDGLLSPQNLVRRLPRILRDPKSRETFLRDGAQEAIKVLDVPSPDEAIKNATLEQLAREINRRVLSMAYSELQRLRSEFNTEEHQALTDARDQLTQLCSDIATDF